MQFKRADAVGVAYITVNMVEVLGFISFSPTYRAFSANSKLNAPFVSTLVA